MNWMGLKRLTALFAAGALAACAAPQAAVETAAPAVARPAMWTLSDADTTIYLFGTIHLLPEGTQWRSARLEEAIASSGELVTEVRIDENAMGAARMMMTMGRASGLPPVVERVPEEKRAALRGLIAASGVPEEALNGMKTWAAALMLAASSFQQLGLQTDLGVEEGLTGTYNAQGKTRSGLETAEQQFGFFDGLSEEGQRAFLASVAEDRQSIRDQFQQMLNAWMRGDTDAIARTFDSELTLTAELRETLMTRRNASWADWLARRLDRPGIVFVAVGAGHLAGRDSVQARLAERGLRTERVQ